MVKIVVIVLVVVTVILGGMYLTNNPGKLSGLVSGLLPEEVNAASGGPGDQDSGVGLNLGLNLGIGRNPNAVLSEAEAEVLRAKIPALVAEQEALTAYQRQLLAGTLQSAIQAGRTENQVQSDLARIEERRASWRAENERLNDIAEREASKKKTTLFLVFGGLLALAFGAAALIYFPSRALRGTASALCAPIIQRVHELTVVSDSPYDVLTGKRNPPLFTQPWKSSGQLPFEGEDAKSLGDVDPQAMLAKAASKAASNRTPEDWSRALTQLASGLRRGDKALPSGDES